MTLLALLLGLQCLTAADSAPEEIRVLAQTAAQQRQEDLKAARTNLEYALERLELVKRGRITGGQTRGIVSRGQHRYEFRNAEDKQRVINTHQQKVDQRIQKVRELESKAYVWPRINTGEPKQWTLGMIGMPCQNGVAGAHLVTVSQVLGPSKMLCRWGGDLFMVRGVSTRGIVDGGLAKIKQLMKVVDTETYNAVVGTNTVFVLEPFPLNVSDYPDLFPAEPPKPTLAAADSEQDDKAPEMRTWTSSDGRYQVKAKFVKATPRAVTLEKEDGAEIRVPLNRLSEEDIDWLKKRARR